MTSVTVDIPYVSDDVVDYKYLIGNMHLNSDDIRHIKVLDVVVEEYDETVGPQIVVYRRHVTPTGRLRPMREKDECPIYIGDIVMYTAEYASEHPEKIFQEVESTCR